jgi:hypothetical protein
MSKLENFISGNRDAFDDAVPSRKVWDNIETGIVKKKGNAGGYMKIITWGLSIAAALMIGIMIYMELNKKNATAPLLVNNEQGINSLAPEYAPQVNEFARLIDLKQEELKVLASEQPELYNKFSNDISQLDSSYNILKSQLKVNPNKELLIEAMIQNLQLQLNVLNQQLNIINQIKQSKKYSHEQNYQNI